MENANKTFVQKAKDFFFYWNLCFHHIENLKWNIFHIKYIN